METSFAISLSRIGRCRFCILQSRKLISSLTKNSRSHSRRFVNTTGFIRSGSSSGSDAREFPEKPTHEIFKPLEGIKVLDLTRVLAGPYCTMILGDLGADVIKVEKPGSGDDTRFWGPPWIETEAGQRSSAYFVSINRNKKSIAVDMKKKEGAQIVQQLAAKSDILVENYIPGKLAEMGLGYHQLHQVAPHLIYASITGFGQTGPYKQRGGYDNIAAAVGGLMHITGPQDGEPCRVGVAMTDLSTGLYSVSAIMAALLHRQTTGRGQHIDCNLLSTQVATLTHIASNHLNCGQEAKRWGSGHGSIVPYQTFKTTDGFLMIGAANDKLFAELCQGIGMPELLDDVRFSSNENRVLNRDVLIKLLEDRFASKSISDWCDALEDTSVPYGPVNSMDQVFSDPQVLHNQMIQEITHPQLGKIRVPGPAVSYSAGELDVMCPPPDLGQHTADVLRDHLDYSPSDIHKLTDRGVIQCTDT